MGALSDTELIVAEKYCHGFTDKEVANELLKPIWTIRTHKKHIHAKLGISTTHELVLYMVALYLGKPWNLKELRKRGLAALLCSLMIFHIVVSARYEYYIMPRRQRTEYTVRRAENDV